MSDVLRHGVRFVRNSRPVIRVLMTKNTYFPIAVARVGRRILVGKRIVEAEAEPWRDAINHDWTLYRNIDPPAQILLDELVRVASQDDRILDICCNVGRHLNFLANNGFERLTGFDVMKSAIEQAPIEFPALRQVHLVSASAPEFFDTCPDDAFDWAYTHSATLELMHPSFQVEREVFRVVTKGAVLLLNPTGHKYPRRYDVRFRQAGFRIHSVTELNSGLVMFNLRKSR